MNESKELWCFKDEKGQERRYVTREFAEKAANGREVYKIKWHKPEINDPWDSLHDEIQAMDVEDLEAVTRRFLPKAEQAKRNAYARQSKWDRSNTTQIKMKLNNNTDKDILQKLDEVGNKQGYIKDLIRKDLKK